MFAHASIKVINELKIDGYAERMPMLFEFVYQFSFFWWIFLSRQLKQTLAFNRLLLAVRWSAHAVLLCSWVWLICGHGHCTVCVLCAYGGRMCVNFHKFSRLPADHVHAISANNNTFFLVQLRIELKYNEC